jgi:hypothetical protein
MILKSNPEMTQDLLDFSVDRMKKYGIVDSGDARTLGIGAMTDTHRRFLPKNGAGGRGEARTGFPSGLHAAFR